MLGTVITVAVTVLIQLGTAIFIYGRLTERVKSHSEDIKDLKAVAQKHEGEIGELFGHVGASRR